MKIKKLTTLNLFMHFVKELSITQDTLSYNYLKIEYATLKTWNSRGHIPSSNLFYVIEGIIDFFKCPPEAISQIYDSPEKLIEKFLNFVKKYGYIVDNYQKSLEEFSEFLVDYFQNRETYSVKSFEDCVMEEDTQRFDICSNTNLRAMLSDANDYFDQSLISTDENQILFTISKNSNTETNKNNIKDYIKKHPHTLLCESGGCGKTVFLKRIEKELYKSSKLTNSERTFYYISLANISSNMLTSIQEKYHEQINDQFCFETSLIISSIIDKYSLEKHVAVEGFRKLGNSRYNPILLLLDGLNEVSGTIYSRIVYEISELKNHNFDIILSSREDNVPLELQDFKKVYISKVPKHLKSSLINKIQSKDKQVLAFIERIINIPFYYNLINDKVSKGSSIPKNEYDILELCYMEYTYEHIKRLVHDGEEFDVLCGVYYCIIPLLAYDMLKPNAIYSISKAEIEGKIDLILSQKELCNVFLRAYMPKHFSTTIELHENQTKKYIKCLINQNWLLCENNIYSFQHQNWADYHAASVAISIIKAYQQNMVTSAEAAADLLCLNLPSSVLHYVGEVFDLNEDTKVSDNAVASFKNIFCGLTTIESAQDIKPEHVYYANILDHFLDFKRNVSINDKTSSVVEEIVDRVISPLYSKFKRDVSSCAYLKDALDNNPYLTEAVRIKLASLIFQKVQIYSVKSTSDPLQETTTRAREYVAFANGVCPLDSVANMDARTDLEIVEDEILKYNRTQNAKAFFDTGCRKLEKLAIERVPMSCNLLALINSFPVPYLVGYSIVNKVNYIKAFTLYASAVIGKEKKGDIILYPIRNMISLLLRGYVQVDSSLLDCYDLTDPGVLKVGSCNGSIYNVVHCNEESLLLAKKLYNMTAGYYRPLMYFYGACIDMMLGNSNSAIEKLKTEIELSSKLSDQFNLQAKILYNHLTRSHTYNISSEYNELKSKLLNKNNQRFWHFDSLYYYLDVKRLELSIDSQRNIFFEKFESKLDFGTLENVQKCEKLITEALN